MPSVASEPPTTLDTKHPPWFSVWHLLLVVPWVPVVIAGRLKLRDNSLLWHIRAGEAQLDQGQVLTTDPFSFTFGGRPWRTQSWLPELGYRWLEERWGLGFVGPLIIVAGTVTLLVLGIVVWRSLRSPLAAGLVLVATSVLLLPFLNPRPVLFSFLLFAVLVLVDGDDRLRWSIPLVMWVWAATHASFVVGGVYLVLQAVPRRRARDTVDVLAAGVASLLTAHGWGVVQILLDFARGRPGLSVIREWEHPDLLSLPMLPLTAGIVALIMGGVRGRLRPGHLWIAVPFLLLAFDSNRSVPAAWIALLPLIALSVGGWDPRRTVQPGHQVVNVAAGALVLLIPFLVPVDSGLDESRFPLEAARHLTAERVFHDDGAGGYLIYAQWPERRVFIDDRAELYGEFLAEFVEVRGARPVWREVFEEHRITQALLKVDDPLAEVLRLAGWSEDHRDERFVVYTMG